jgi:hypothetical protein
VPLPLQQKLIEAAKADGARFDFEQTVEASHSPFLSKVEETSAFIRKVATAV